jgi:hypothetical protein
MTKIEEILSEYRDSLNKLLIKHLDKVIIEDDNSCILAFEDANKRCTFTAQLNELGAPYQYLNHNKIEVFFKDDRYPEKPHQFKLVKLQELPAFLIGPDGKCDCTSTDNCIDNHKRHKNRCTLKELEKLSSEAVSRRARQSGDW